MKKLFLIMAVLAFVLAGLSGCAESVKQSAPKYQSTFQGVPLKDRVGGEWTGGPPAGK